MAFDLPSDPEEEEIPDWLQNLQGGDAADAGGASDESEDMLDWLDDDSQSGEPAAPFGDSLAPDDDEEVPGWLSGIRDAEANEGRDPRASWVGVSDSAAAENEAWLESIRDQHRQDTGGLEWEEPEEDSDDYMDRIQELKAADEAETVGAEDWLRGLSEEETLPPTGVEAISFDDDETPDWLSGVAGDAAPSGVADAISFDDDETPAWLSGTTAPAAPRDAGGEVSLEGFEASDWMEPQAIPESDEDDETGAPADWLTGLHADLPQEEDVDSDIPDWLKKIKTGQLPPIEAVERKPQEEEEDADWSASLREDASAAVEAVDEEFPGLPDEPAEGLSQVPSWLADMEDDRGQSVRPVMTTGSLLDDIKELPDMSAFTSEIDQEDLSFDLDLPDWLSEAAAEEEKERQRQQQMLAEQQPELEEFEAPTAEGAPAFAEDIDEADLARAELPSWLQAMRPDGEGISETGQLMEASGPEETIGPLAGLRNVLPAEPGIVHFGKPPEPVQGLTITDAQRQHIQILEELIELEAEARPVSRRKVALPQQILRWIIAALLYLVVLAPVFFESQAVALPPITRVPAEIRAVQDLVNGLAPGAPVLLAFDYQPAFSAEIEAAGASLVDHLILTGHPLVLVSTKPTGPGLAEYFLINTQSDHAYVTDSQYISLGYISGGTAGLANLSTNLRGSFPLQNPDGTSQWEQPPLAGVASLRDFGMVVVLTDNPDIARSWVEQVQVRLVNPDLPPLSTPMVMVVSAQAEPLVYPYYDNNPRQVAGMVAGISGGAYYENSLRVKVARQYWDAYSAGLTVTFLILGVAGMYNLLRGLIARREERSRKS